MDLIKAISHCSQWVETRIREALFKVSALSNG